MAADGKQFTYELLAKAKRRHYTNTDRTAGNYAMYLPGEAYLQAVTRPVVMSYAFNVKGEALSMETF